MCVTNAWITRRRRATFRVTSFGGRSPVSRVQLADFAASAERPHRLLIIIVGLLVGLCSALFFFVFQLKQIRAASLRKDKQIDSDKSEAPDGAFDAHWKGRFASVSG